MVMIISFDYLAHPEVTLSMAGDESHNVGIFVRTIFERPKRSLSKRISCESERRSCRQWVADLNEAVRSQGLEKTSITFEGCYHEINGRQMGCHG